MIRVECGNIAVVVSQIILTNSSHVELDHFSN